MKAKRIECRFLRHTALWLLLLTGLYATPLRAQEQTITLPSQRLTAGEAISQIESQAGLIIGVNHSNFDIRRYIAPPSTRMNLDQLLDLIVAGTDHTYIRRDRHVIIVAQEKKTPVKVAVIESTPARPVVSQEQIEAAMMELIPDIPAEELPEPEIRTYKNVSYGDSGQRLSFSTEDTPGLTPLAGRQPSLALKSNLGYAAATLTPNLGMEFGLGRKTTLEVSAGWNPWGLDGKENDNKKLVHIIVQPEFRWWTCERFNGHFFGLHAQGAVFNISQHKLGLFDFEKQYRYQGHALGAGVSYGYSVMLSPVINLEFTAGLGVWWLDYDRYSCDKCARTAEPFDKFYFGPTKAAVSLVFILK